MACRSSTAWRAMAAVPRFVGSRFAPAARVASAAAATGALIRNEPMRAAPARALSVGGYENAAVTRDARSAAAMAAAVLAAAALAGGGAAVAACEAAAPPAKDEKGAAPYAEVREAVSALLDDDADLGPTLVRLAWHGSGTYDRHSRTGGSAGGTIRFKPESEHNANAGLPKAMHRLEPIKARFADAISYADLYTLAGVVAIEHMGGPAIAWRPGRTDASDGGSCSPDGRLPNAEQPDPHSGSTLAGTVHHVRSVFDRMGFSAQELVALSGAHALGRCHPSASGYTGPWTRAPTTFSNEYFRELLENTWTLKQWNGPVQYEDPTGELMMLPSDMALLWDRELRGYVELYAKDEAKFFDDFAYAFGKLLELGVPGMEAQKSVSAQRIEYHKEELKKKMGEVERAAASAKAALEEQLADAQRQAAAAMSGAGDAAAKAREQWEPKVRELEQALSERVSRDGAQLKQLAAELQQKLAEEKAYVGQKVSEGVDKAKEIKKSWWG